jgi:Leucine-rich repeat (LRR) protein
MNCPSYQELEEFAVGAASDAAGDAIAGHLSGCARCDQVVAQLERGGDSVLTGLRIAVKSEYSQEPDCRQAIELLKQAIASSDEAPSVLLGDAGGSAAGTDLQAGSQFGPYRIEGKLGQGGMGAVYKAIHPRLNRVVAIKLIAFHLRDPQRIARFNREMQAVAALDHPAIVRAYDGGEHGGFDYLVMEYIAGFDLARLAGIDRLSVADACELARQAALGLAHLHGRGLVHRDIKPSNLILCLSGQLKILDLGLARLIEPAAEDHALTGADHPLGTSDYLAPEQAVGSRAIDARADLYSLGATLFRLLAGHAPFDDAEHTSALSKMIAHVHDDRPRLIDARPDAPRALSKLIEKLMAQLPADRPQTAAEVAALLGPFAAGADLAALVAKTQIALPVDRAGGSRAGSDVLPAGQAMGFAATSTDARTTAPAHAAVRSRGLRWPVIAGLLAVSAIGLMSLLTWTLLKHPAGTAARAGAPGGAAAEKLPNTLPDVPVATTQKPPAAPAENEMPADKNEAETATAATPKRVLGPIARDPAFDRWVTDVAALPAAKQVEAVVRKLEELNPGYDGKEVHEIEDGAVTELRFVTDHITDIFPVRALSALKTLHCAGSSLRKGKLADLRAVQGMHLTSLDCGHSRVSDLSPLEGMPLTELGCEGSPVTDLSPLEGMQLTAICLTPKQIRTDMEVIRRMKSLKTIGLDSDREKVAADEFWKQYDAGEFGKPVVTFDDPGFKQWMSNVAAMPAEKQVEAVVERLRILNPDFDGKESHKIEFGMVTELKFSSSKITDLSPVRALRRLKSLECRSKPEAGVSKLWDLSPLEGMRLQRLDCSGTEVSELAPLKGMPLTQLECNGTEVVDLSPLKGLPLARLECGSTKVSDLSPLAGMPLTLLFCGATQVSDLSPLQGMPLTHLNFHGAPVTDLSPLAGMQLTSLACGGGEFADLSQLKGLPLKELFCSQSQVADLSPLKGMALTSLSCYETQVSDLSPLEGMPLTSLSCTTTQVSDLSPLKGMPLAELFVANTPVSDLSPLKQVPLTRLQCEETRVTDLLPLAGMSLGVFTFSPQNITQGLNVIRQMKSIGAIGVRYGYAMWPPDEFWKRFDAGEFGK